MSVSQKHSLPNYGFLIAPVLYVVNKLAKFSNNPGMTHFRALLHLIGYIKKNSNKEIKFYSNIKDTLIMTVV